MEFPGSGGGGDGRPEEEGEVEDSPARGANPAPPAQVGGGLRAQAPGTDDDDEEEEESSYADDEEDGDGDGEGESSASDDSMPALSYELEQGQRILRELMADSNKSVNWPFMEAVDASEPYLRDYYDRVKKPMWMQKMKKKFKRRVYESLTEFVADFRLMLENCYRYNGPDHYISKRGQRLEIMLEQKLALLSRELREKTTISATSGIPVNESYTGGLRRRTRTLLPHDSSALLNQLRLEEAEREKMYRRQQISDRRAAQEAYLQQLQDWEDQLLVEPLGSQMRSMWELPQIGHFLFLCQEPLNLGEIIHYELERCFLVPRESSTMQRIMTSLLSTPHQRQRLDKCPWLPYKVWEEKLKVRVQQWYNTLEAYENDVNKAAEVLGLDPFFFKVAGKRNPLQSKKYHELSYYKKVWLMKSVCDHCLETQESLRDAIESQVIEEQRDYLLGHDAKGNSYLHFPQFCGNDVRIYKQKPFPEPNVESFDDFDFDEEDEDEIKNKKRKSVSTKDFDKTYTPSKKRKKKCSSEVPMPPLSGRPSRLRQQIKTVLPPQMLIDSESEASECSIEEANPVGDGTDNERQRTADDDTACNGAELKIAGNLYKADNRNGLIRTLQEKKKTIRKGKTLNGGGTAEEDCKTIFSKTEENKDVEMVVPRDSNEAGLRQYKDIPNKHCMDANDSQPMCKYYLGVPTKHSNDKLCKNQTSDAEKLVTRQLPLQTNLVRDEDESLSLIMNDAVRDISGKCSSRSINLLSEKEETARDGRDMAAAVCGELKGKDADQLEKPKLDEGGTKAEVEVKQKYVTAEENASAKKDREDSEEELTPEIGPFQLIVDSMESLRQLTQQFAKPEPVVTKGSKKQKGRVPQRQKCVARLHERLTYLLKELEPWESKLVMATKKARKKMKKEQEEYKEDPEPEQEKASSWGSEESASNSDKESSSESESEAVTSSRSASEDRKICGCKSASRAPKITIDDAGQDVSSRGRVRKRRIIPNNTEDGENKQRKVVKKLEPSFPSPISTNISTLVNFNDSLLRSTYSTLDHLPLLNSSILASSSQSMQSNRLGQSVLDRPTAAHSLQVAMKMPTSKQVSYPVIQQLLASRKTLPASTTTTTTISSSLQPVKNIAVKRLASAATSSIPTKLSSAEAKAKLSKPATSICKTQKSGEVLPCSHTQSSSSGRVQYYTNLANLPPQILQHILKTAAQSKQQVASTVGDTQQAKSSHTFVLSPSLGLKQPANIILTSSPAASQTVKIGSSLNSTNVRQGTKLPTQQFGMVLNTSAPVTNQFTASTRNSTTIPPVQGQIKPATNLYLIPKSVAAARLQHAPKPVTISKNMLHEQTNVAASSALHSSAATNVPQTSVMTGGINSASVNSSQLPSGTVVSDGVLSTQNFSTVVVQNDSKVLTTVPKFKPVAKLPGKYACNVTVKSLLENRAAKKSGEDCTDDLLSTSATSQTFGMDLPLEMSDHVQEQLSVPASYSGGLHSPQKNLANIESSESLKVSNPFLESALQTVMSDVKTSLPTVHIKVPAPITMPLIQPRTNITQTIQCNRMPITVNSLVKPKSVVSSALSNPFSVAHGGSKLVPQQSTLVNQPVQSATKPNARPLAILQPGTGAGTKNIILKVLPQTVLTTTTQLTNTHTGLLLSMQPQQNLVLQQKPALASNIQHLLSVPQQTLASASVAKSPAKIPNSKPVKAAVTNVGNMFAVASSAVDNQPLSSAAITPLTLLKQTQSSHTASNPSSLLAQQNLFLVTHKDPVLPQQCMGIPLSGQNNATELMKKLTAKQLQVLTSTQSKVPQNTCVTNVNYVQQGALISQTFAGKTLMQISQDNTTPVSRASLVPLSSLTGMSASNTPLKVNPEIFSSNAKENKTVLVENMQKNNASPLKKTHPVSNLMIHAGPPSMLFPSERADKPAGIQSAPEGCSTEASQSLSVPLKINVSQIFSSNSVASERTPAKDALINLTSTVKEHLLKIPASSLTTAAAPCASSSLLQMAGGRHANLGPGHIIDVTATTALPLTFSQETTGAVAKNLFLPGALKVCSQDSAAGQMAPSPGPVAKVILSPKTVPSKSTNIPDRLQPCPSQQAQQNPMLKLALSANSKSAPSVNRHTLLQQQLSSPPKVVGQQQADAGQVPGIAPGVQRLILYSVGGQLVTPQGIPVTLHNGILKILPQTTVQAPSQVMLLQTPNLQTTIPAPSNLTTKIIRSPLQSAQTQTIFVPTTTKAITVQQNPVQIRQGQVTLALPAQGILPSGTEFPYQFFTKINSTASPAKQINPNISVASLSNNPTPKTLPKLVSEMAYQNHETANQTCPAAQSSQSLGCAVVGQGQCISKVPADGHSMYSTGKLPVNPDSVLQVCEKLNTVPPPPLAIVRTNENSFIQSTSSQSVLEKTSAGPSGSALVESGSEKECCFSTKFAVDDQQPSLAADIENDADSSIEEAAISLLSFAQQALSENVSPPEENKTTTAAGSHKETQQTFIQKVL